MKIIPIPPEEKPVFKPFALVIETEAEFKEVFNMIHSALRGCVGVHRIIASKVLEILRTKLSND